MSHQVSLLNNVLTLRISGRTDSPQIQQALYAHLTSQKMPVALVIDLTFATGFDQQMKAVVFRMAQSPLINRLGICSVNPALAADVTEIASALERVRPVVVANTENEVLVKLGLIDPPSQPRKMTGMLAHLKRPDSPTS